MECKRTRHGESAKNALPRRRYFTQEEKFQGSFVHLFNPLPKKWPIQPADRTFITPCVFLSFMIVVENDRELNPTEP